MDVKIKEVLKISSLPVVLASLCCLTPVILVLLGLSTVSFASSLGDTLYGENKWYFRAFGLVTLAAAIIIYLRRAKGICTIDQAKKHRNETINIIAISLIAGVLGYLFFLYVVVHIIGTALDIWPF